MRLERIAYRDLNARQKEAYNLQKLSAVLADYGIITIKLSSDWEGADLIAQHAQTLEYTPIQLKGRFYLGKRYQGKGLWIAFRNGTDWYLYDHDAVLEQMREQNTPLFKSRSWVEGGAYSYNGITSKLAAILEPYRLD